MTWFRALTLISTLVAPAALGHDRIADPCGCHSQYGTRHCHSKKKTVQCEAPVAGKKKQTVPVKKHASL
jgi:hypothetical protein